MTAGKLNPTAASLLGFLHDGPLTGWDLVQTAQRVIGDFWSLTQSQVYRELTVMAERGLVVAGERGSRDRRPFTITEAGREAFAEWVRREPGDDTIRMPLLLAVAFGRHVPPERMWSFIRHQREAHARRLAGYQESRAAMERAPEVDAYAAATLDFGIRYERAVLDWFAALAPAIRGPAAVDQPSEPVPPGPRRTTRSGRDAG